MAEPKSKSDKQKRLDKLAHQLLHTKMTLDQYADKANKLDDPQLWDATKRAKVMKGQK